MFAIGVFDAEVEQGVCLRRWKVLGACFSKSLSERGPPGFCSFPLRPSTNGRSVRLKAPAHRFQARVLQVYTATISISARWLLDARVAHVQNHHRYGLSNNNRDCLLALSAATARKLVREEDWPALIPKVGVPISRIARGKYENFEQLRERAPRVKHSLVCS